MLEAAPRDLEALCLARILKTDSFAAAATPMTMPLSDMLHNSLEPFKHLDTFSICGSLIEDEAMNLPFLSTLSELTLQQFDYYPFQFLFNQALLSSSLTNVTLEFGLIPLGFDHSPIPDLGSIWPPSLKTMDINFASQKRLTSTYTERHKIGKVFPSSLTALTLRIGGRAHLQEVVNGLEHLNSLTSLDFSCEPQTELEFVIPKFIDSWTPHVKFCFATLPRGIKRLTLDGSSFDNMQKRDLEALPPSITFLAISTSKLSLAMHIRQLFPDCSIRLLHPVNVWRGDGADVMRQELPQLVASPTKDINAFMHSIWQYFRTRKVHIILDTLSRENIASLETTSLNVTVREENGASFKIGEILRPKSNFLAFPKLHKLVLAIPPPTITKMATLETNHLPSALTHLELTNVVVMTVNSVRLPSTLTHIASNSEIDLAKCSVTFNMFPALRYLDTACWT